MVTFQKITILEDESTMKSKSETNITMTLEEFEAYNHKRQPVSDYINNAFVVWGLFFGLLGVLGFLLWGQISDGISSADEKADKAIELITENQQKNLELFKSLQSNVAKNSTTQEQTVKTLESINDKLGNTENRLFTIETSRYTDGDAEDLEEKLKANDADIESDVKQNTSDIKTVEKDIIDVKTSVASVRVLAEQNARLLTDRTQFINDMRQRVGDLEKKTMEKE